MESEILPEEIKKALTEYSSKVEACLKKEVDRCTDEALLAIKAAAKQKIGGSGEYKKGFRQRKVADDDGYKRKKIINSEYQLTYLLENGHVKRYYLGDTLVTDGRVPARPHWAEGQKIADELPERMEKRLKELTRNGTE